MTTITITEENYNVKVEVTDVSEDFDDSSLCALLISVYLKTAKDLMATHDCDNPDCCFGKFNTEITQAIEETSKLHAITHKHAK